MPYECIIRQTQFELMHKTDTNLLFTSLIKYDFLHLTNCYIINKTWNISDIMLLVITNTFVLNIHIAGELTNYTVTSITPWNVRQ